MSKRNLILSASSGLLLFLSFPRTDFWFLAFAALVPLLIALRGSTVRDGFKAGFLTGLVCHLGLIYWVAFVIVKYGGLPLYAGIAAMLVLSAVLGIYTGLFGAGVAFFAARGIPVVVAAPVLWTGIEYGKSHLFSGFPWENLAYSQYLNTPLVQMADLTGTYGLTFLIVFLNAVISDLLRVRDLGKKAVLSEVTAAGLVLIAAVSYGYYRIGAVRAAYETLPVREVVIVQGNVDQSVKWDPGYQDETIEIYNRLSLESPPSGPGGLIVWPETATPFYFQNLDDQHRRVAGIAVKTKCHLLFGSPSYVLEKGEESILNSAFLLSPEGNIEGKYDKVHLVPFGEYVPLRAVFPFMGKLVAGVGDFLPGKGFFPLPLGANKIGTLICYEGIFPEIAREYKKRGAQVLVNITNDAWFGRTSAPYQHLSMVTFRSIENRVYTVRAANTGISAVILPTGEIAAATGLFERTSLKGNIRFVEGQTFYSSYGDVFAYGCLAALFLLGVISTRRKGR